MYSKINVDVSCKDIEFDTVRIPIRGATYRGMAYKVLPIIRGSSTVNGDSAHSPTQLARQHNYVTFNIKKIKLSCSFITNDLSTDFLRLSYIVLFKIPYIDENHLPKLNPNGGTGSLSNFILYNSPENVLNYGCLNLTTTKNHTDYTLYCNKSIYVGPNDYLGVSYLLIPNGGNNAVDVYASAEVTFKPI